MRRVWAFFAAMAVGLTTARCHHSPAGPSNSTVIAARPAAPANDAQIADVAQPLALLVTNGVSASAGSLTVTFEVATDSAFANTIVTKTVSQSGDGQTTLKLDPLPAAKDYYWRARTTARDGSAVLSPAFHFRIVVPSEPQCAATLSGSPAISSDADFGPQGAVCVSGAAPRLMTNIHTSRAFSIGSMGLTFPVGTVNAREGTTGTFAGPLSGEGGVTVLMSSIALTAANSYRGGTTVAAVLPYYTGGRISIRSDDNLGAEAGGVVLNPGYVEFLGDFHTNRRLTLGPGVDPTYTGGTLSGDGFNVTWSGPITGSGDLRLYNGTFVLNGVNTYTGRTTSSLGVLAIDADTNLGAPSSVLVFEGTLRFLADIAVSHNMTMTASEAGPKAFLDTNGHDVTLAAVFSGGQDARIPYAAASVLTKIGAGTLTLSAANTFITTPLRITGGTIAVAADENLGRVDNGISLEGGALRFLRSFSTSRSIVLGAGGGTIDTGGNNVVLTGPISGGGTLTKLGSGTLTLSGAVSYTGGTIVQSGKVVGAP